MIVRTTTDDTACDATTDSNGVTVSDLSNDTTTYAAIRAVEVTRSYGSHQALAGVDLEVKVGEVVAILGPNGAGKTTLIEILEGLRRRDSGEVAVLGQDPRTGNTSWRARIGAVLQLGTETDEFTVAEMIGAEAAYYPKPRDVQEVISALDLADLADKRVRRLSGGQRRRLDLALGVIGNPELIFLDEPTTGLDPEARRSIWDLIRDLREAGTTVVLTTHYLDEVEHLAERAVVLVDGKVVWKGKTAELRGGPKTSIVGFALDEALTSNDLPASLPGVRLQGNDSDVRYETGDPTEFVAVLMTWAAQIDVAKPVIGLEITRPTLEEAYLELLDSANNDCQQRLPSPMKATGPEREVQP